MMSALRSEQVPAWIDRLKPSFQNARFLAVALAAAMSLMALILSAVTWARIRSSVRELERASKLGVGWARLLSLLKDSETGERGYLLTGDESYLEPYKESRQRVPMELETLRNDAASFATADELKQISRLVAERLEYADEKIFIRRREGLDAVVPMVQTNKGKNMMDALRGKIGEMEDRQSRRISEMSAMMESDLHWGYVSATSSGIIGLVAGCIAFFMLRETAARARHEERLSVEKRRAEEADRQKSSFLATMSHEIRTPMNAILGFSELLEGEATTPKQKQYTQSILSGGRTLLQLINDILDLSKIEAGMFQVKHEPTDVREVSSLLRQLFTQQASVKKLAFRVDVNDAVPNTLLLDSARLRQILINVVGNALKFTERGHVHVRFFTEDQPDRHSRVSLAIEVEDTGLGIEAASQETIFKPFVQGASSSVAAQKGTGLGLAIVRRLVDLMGGRITLKSERGVGSTFRFDFPQVEISSRLAESQLEDGPTVDFNELRPSKILLADDNETNRELVKGIFEQTHHTLRVANDGAEAVREIEKERPDVVLMDIRMPGMDGSEALRVIRSKPDYNLLPVIAVTASSLTSQERELRRAFDGYVRKPFTRAILFKELAQFIPKVGKTGAAETPCAEPSLSAEDAARWKDYVIQLRRTEQSTWPEVKERMVMSEVKAFAAALVEGAKVARCAPIELYALQLAADADSFSISALERGLAALPDRIAYVETLAERAI